MRNKSKFKVLLKNRYVKVSPTELAASIKLFYSTSELVEFLLELEKLKIVNWDALCDFVWKMVMSIEEE